MSETNQTPDPSGTTASATGPLLSDPQPEDLASRDDLLLSYDRLSRDGSLAPQNASELERFKAWLAGGRVRAVAEAGAVKIYLSPEEPQFYVGKLDELLDAAYAYRVHEADLSRIDLQPYRERLNAAEQDVEEALSETLSIEAAERLHAALYGAIVRAKVESSVFAYTDGD